MRGHPHPSAHRRAAFATPVDPFTIALLGFGLLAWIVLLQTSFSALTACHFAELWLAGWFERRAPLQVLGLAVFMFAALYVVRLFTTGIWTARRWEAVAQGVFIAFLALSLGALRAHVIPNGFPPDAFYWSVWSPGPTLLNDHDRSLQPAWPYDYPAPPPHPSSVDITTTYRLAQAEGGTELNPNRALIAGAAPTRAELAAISACRMRYQDAEAAMLEWERGFHAWLAANPLIDDQMIDDPRQFTRPDWAER